MESTTYSVSREDHTPPFGKLSIDLVLQITESLPIESVFALALTTKPLYYSQALQKAWKSDVRLYPSRCAQLMARYTPEWVHCAFCRRLHPRRTTPKITSDWFSLDPCACKPPHPHRRRTTLEIIHDWASLPPNSLESPRSVWLHLDPWDYHLRSEDVYKVMIRHLWGAPYGDNLLYTWTNLGMCDYNLSNEWTVATTTEWKPYHDRWNIFNRNYGLDHVSDICEQITEADSELCHRSFQRAKNNLAIRNQRLHALKLCSEDQSTTQDTVVPSTYQDDQSEQALPKKISRVSRFVERLRRTVPHSFGRRES